MRLSLSCVLVIGLFTSFSFAQERPSSRFGVGAAFSTLGIGVEGAVAVTARSNVRGGFNFFDYSRAGNRDGIHYDGTITLRSIQATYDQYLVKGFHVSPGVLLYNDNHATGSASVPGGQSFTLGDVRYFSSATNPVTGNATLKIGKAAPMVLFGVGNLIPRSHRHLGFNIDAGVAFQGSPDLKLGLGAPHARSILPAVASTSQRIPQYRPTSNVNRLRTTKISRR